MKKTLDLNGNVLDVNNADPVNEAIRALVCAARGKTDDGSPILLEGEEVVAYANLLIAVNDFDLAKAND